MHVKCNKCSSDILFCKTCVKGLGFQVLLKCSCPKNIVIDSCNRIQTDYEINRKFVFVMRLIGGVAGVKLFVGMMDLENDFSNNMYYGVIENISIATQSVYDIVIQKAGSEEKKLLKKEGKSFYSVWGWYMV